MLEIKDIINEMDLNVDLESSFDGGIYFGEIEKVGDGSYLFLTDYTNDKGEILLYHRFLIKIFSYGKTKGQLKEIFNKVNTFFLEGCMGKTNYSGKLVVSTNEEPGIKIFTTKTLGKKRNIIIKGYTITEQYEKI